MKKLLLFFLFTLISSVVIQNEDVIVKAPSEEKDIEELVEKFIAELIGKEKDLYKWLDEHYHWDNFLQFIINYFVDDAIQFCNKVTQKDGEVDDTCKNFVEKLINYINPDSS